MGQYGTSDPRGDAALLPTGRETMPMLIGLSATVQFTSPSFVTLETSSH